jgi:hypothetical protein
MLDLSTAVLCDFAQVRDRLLFVSSGAVSRLYRQELPSPLGLMVGLVIEVPLEDAGMEHKLRAEVINRHGTVLATLENLFRVGDVGLFPHEVQQVPLVLSITGVRARTWGTHQVRLYLDDELVRALTLYVVPAAGPQAVVRATPTQSRVDDDEGTVGGPGPEDGEEVPAAFDEPEPDANEPVELPEPASAEDAGAGDSHQIVIDVDQPVDDDVVHIESDDAGAAAPAAPTPEPEPAPEAEPAGAPAWGQPQQATIDAPTASEAASTPEWRTAAEPASPHAEFDEDDLDADPANRPPADADDQSRFSFRYRYEGDDADA